MTAVSFPVRIFALAVVVLGIGALTRYRFIEPQWITLWCESAEAPWWCPLRMALIKFFYYYGFGYLALAAALAALFVRRRWLVGSAVAIGAAGTFLYNTDLAAPALLLGLMLSFSVAPEARA